MGIGLQWRCAVAPSTDCDMRLRAMKTPGNRLTSSVLLHWTAITDLSTSRYRRSLPTAVQITANLWVCLSWPVVFAASIGTSSSQTDAGKDTLRNTDRIRPEHLNLYLTFYSLWYCKKPASFLRLQMEIWLMTLPLHLLSITLSVILGNWRAIHFVFKKDEAHWVCFIEKVNLFYLSEKQKRVKWVYLT